MGLGSVSERSGRPKRPTSGARTGRCAASISADRAAPSTPLRQGQTMRDTSSTSIHINGHLEITLDPVLAPNAPKQGRSMLRLSDPNNGEPAMLVIFADDDVLTRLALDLLELLPIKTIAWERARRTTIPADDPFANPTTHLTAAELGAQS